MSIDMGAALSSVASDVTSQIAGVLPVVLPVFGGLVAIGIGLKVFKKVTGKA